MVNYNYGKIYKIINNINDKIYVGSTCDTLTKRIASHKSLSKRATCDVYSQLNIIGWDNVDIELIEDFPCENRDQLLHRERLYIELLEPELNKNRPIMTEAEREVYQEVYQRIYQRENAVNYKAYQKIYQREYRLRKKVNV